MSDPLRPDAFDRVGAWDEYVHREALVKVEARYAISRLEIVQMPKDLLKRLKDNIRRDMGRLLAQEMMKAGVVKYRETAMNHFKDGMTMEASAWVINPDKTSPVLSKSVAEVFAILEEFVPDEVLLPLIHDVVMLIANVNPSVFNRELEDKP